MDQKKSIKTYKDYIDTETADKKIIKLYADNILVRDDWAATHYRYRYEYLESGKKYVGDRMQFFKFIKEGTDYKIEKTWIK